MLQAMRQLALDWLRQELNGGGQVDSEDWYQRLQEREASRIFPKLVEPLEKIERFYTLRPDLDDPSVAVLEVHDLRDGDAIRVPFNQPSGSQAPALGPVLKRTPGDPSKKKPAGPSTKIQETTLKAFDTIAGAQLTWSPFFSRAGECFRRKKVRDMIRGEVSSVETTALSWAIEAIREKKTTLLCYQEPGGELPGDVMEYVAYLSQVLRQTKYATDAIPAMEDGTCQLCGRASATVYPNALRGAGLNLANMDRAGAFPGIDDSRALSRFAVCGNCADLLYIYKFHYCEKFQTSVAGERALVVPSTGTDQRKRGRFIDRVIRFVDGVQKGEVAAREDALLRLLAEEKAITELTFVWATFGQRIEDVRGVLSDVLPSRLHAIEGNNGEIQSAKSPLYPEYELSEFRYDLSLSILKKLFERPGGKKVRTLNESKRLFDLKRDLAAAVYHGTEILPGRFWDELMMTARCHIDQACAGDDSWGLLHEGYSPKKRAAYLTTAGWVRELARFLHFLRRTGLIPMPENIYQPQCAVLKPYFTIESAIDSRQKAFAFILGALFGKMMQVQAARGVNVGANALTWLKRLTLSGKDLPELYTRVREKLLVYETEGNEVVRQLVGELGELGAVTKWDDDLDQVQTCYFLLLGQSLATRLMPSKAQPDGKGDQS